MNSISISWDNAIPNCEEEEHFFYLVDLLYPNGTLDKTNVTINHITFVNLTEGTTYVITVSTTGIASSSETINVTTATTQSEG